MVRDSEMCSLTSTSFIKLESECFCMMLILLVDYIIFNRLTLVPFICLCDLSGPSVHLNLRHRKVSSYVLGKERWDA